MKRLLSVLVLALIGMNSVLAAHKAEGTINKVLKDQKKLNITHGPIKTMNMMGMTMNFTVSDPAMLDEVKEGMKVNFELDKDNSGQFIITYIEAQ